MSKTTVFWRATPGAEGVNGVTISAKTIAGVTLDSEVTAGTGADKGQVTLDVGYPGPHYVTGVKDGVTLQSSSRDIGFAGTFSLYDLPDAFTLWTDGVIAGKDNACAVSTNTSTRSVDVATGTIMGKGHPFTVRTSTNVLVTANASGLARKDLIVARFYPRGTADEGKWLLAAVAGTPAASPVAPSPTQNASIWEVPLSVVTVANGATSFTGANLLDSREYASVLVELADVNGLVAALALKAPLAAPAFTGGASVTGALTANSGLVTTFVTASTNVSMSGNLTVGGTVTIPDASLTIADTSGLQAALDAKATTAAVALKADAANPVFTGTVTIPDGALAQADVSGLVAALAAKAALVDPTFTHNITVVNDLAVGGGSALSGNITASGGFHHTGGTWGFNSASVSGKQSDPDNVSTGTIDATWGSPEALVLENLRTSFNQLVQTLRDIGLLTA